MGTRCTLLRPGLTDYQTAWQLQRRVADDVRGGAEPALILLEHPPTYTLGARGNTEHLLVSREAFAARGATVIESDRGGDVTFHGPGQLVAYPILDLRRFGQGPVWYVRALEGVVIEALARFGIVAGRVAGRAGVWVRDAKIAAIGVRVSRGVTTHGFALNVNTDLRWFDNIVPCGISDAGVTSMEALAGCAFEMRDVEREVVAAFALQFDMEFVEAAETAVGRGEERRDDALTTMEPDSGLHHALGEILRCAQNDSIMQHSEILRCAQDDNDEDEAGPNHPDEALSMTREGARGR